MKRRLHLIPFTVKVPDKKKDPNLSEKLLQERDGILAWAINCELDELAQQDGIIKAEAQGEAWLPRSWRPLVMMVFTALIVCHRMGWAPRIQVKRWSRRCRELCSWELVATLPVRVSKRSR